MCWKYKNPHGTVFVQCDVLNSKPFSPHFLPIGEDVDYHYLNYCPYCGKRLEEKNDSPKERSKL